MSTTLDGTRNRTPEVPGPSRPQPAKVFLLTVAHLSYGAEAALTMGAPVLHVSRKQASRSKRSHSKQRERERERERERRPGAPASTPSERKKKKQERVLGAYLQACSLQLSGTLQRLVAPWTGESLSSALEDSTWTQWRDSMGPNGRRSRLCFCSASSAFLTRGPQRAC